MPGFHARENQCLIASSLPGAIRQIGHRFRQLLTVRM
jgi:hypothetical protein